MCALCDTSICTYISKEPRSGNRSAHPVRQHPYRGRIPKASSPAYAPELPSSTPPRSLSLHPSSLFPSPSLLSLSPTLTPSLSPSLTYLFLPPLPLPPVSVSPSLTLSFSLSPSRRPVENSLVDATCSHARAGTNRSSIRACDQSCVSRHQRALAIGSRAASASSSPNAATASRCACLHNLKHSTTPQSQTVISQCRCCL